MIITKITDKIVIEVIPTIIILCLKVSLDWSCFDFRWSTNLSNGGFRTRMAVKAVHVPIKEPKST